jgi:GTP-binding protein
MGELRRFGTGLERKPMIVVASKADVANEKKLEKLRTYAAKMKFEFYEISAVTGRGIPELEWAMARYVEEVRRRITAGEEVEGVQLFKAEDAPKASSSRATSRKKSIQKKGRITMAAKKAAKKAVKKTAKKAAKKTAKKK